MLDLIKRCFESGTEAEVNKILKNILKKDMFFGYGTNVINYRILFPVKTEKKNQNKAAKLVLKKENLNCCIACQYKKRAELKLLVLLSL